MRNAIATFIISATVALLPVYNRVSFVDMSRTSKDNLLMVILAFLTLLINDEKRKLPFHGWCTVVIAILFSVLNQHSVASIVTIIQTAYFLIAVFFFVRLYECLDFKWLDNILDGMCVGVIIQCVFVGLAHFGIPLEFLISDIFNDGIRIDGVLTPVFGSSFGSLANPNMLGSYVAICSMAFMREKWVLFSPLAIICLLSTGSIMGLASFTVGLFYFFGHQFKKPIFLLAIVSMLAMPFFDLSGVDSGRFAIWKELLKNLSIEQLLIGSGLGWFADKGFALNGARVIQEHNAFLTLLNSFGLVGVAIFAKYLWKFLNNNQESRLFSTILFVAFCNSYGHFTLHQSTVIIPIIVALVVCSIGEKYDELEWRIAS